MRTKQKVINILTNYFENAANQKLSLSDNLCHIIFEFMKSPFAMRQVLNAFTRNEVAGYSFFKRLITTRWVVVKITFRFVYLREVWGSRVKRFNFFGDEHGYYVLSVDGLNRLRPWGTCTRYCTLP